MTSLPNGLISEALAKIVEGDLPAKLAEPIEATSDLVEIRKYVARTASALYIANPTNGDWHDFADLINYSARDNAGTGFVYATGTFIPQN